jgi:hypothetical protein
VKKDAYDLPINARHYVDDQRARKDILNLVRQAYMKAPHYSEVFALVETLLLFGETNVARFNENLIRRIAEFMGLTTRIINSSEMEKNNSLAGEQRVIEICRRLGATDYTNPIGGTELYHHKVFSECDIALHFLEADNVSYPQFQDTWTPFLSVIDVLMFNARSQLANLLGKCTIRTPGQMALQR